MEETTKPIEPETTLQTIAETEIVLVDKQFDYLKDALCPSDVSYALNLSEKEKQFITNIINDPQQTILAKMHHTVQEIVKDGKFDLHDIPRVILFLTQVYEGVELAIDFSDVRIPELVRFTAHVFIQAKIFPIIDTAQEGAHAVIDASMKLLSKTVVPNLQNIPKGCFGCFSGLNKK